MVELLRDLPTATLVVPRPLERTDTVA
jgi:hypothetical protein